jgi:membrane protease YdiL (CAAX protease family)
VTPTPDHAAGVSEIAVGGLPRRSAFFALGETLALFAVFFMLIKYLETTWVGPLQLQWVGWDFFAHLMMVALPCVLWLVCQRPWGQLGWQRWGRMSPQARQVTWAGPLALALVWLAVLVVVKLMSGSWPAWRLPPEHIGYTLGWSPVVRKVTGVLVTAVFTIVFCGVGEEVLFRGYIQGRLNRAFGRPVIFRGVRVGWGLLVASVLFGLGHALGYYNPLVDAAFHPNWAAGVATMAQGVIFGLIYEATGGILAPAALHAAIGLLFGTLDLGN